MEEIVKNINLNATLASSPIHAGYSDIVSRESTQNKETGNVNTRKYIPKSSGPTNFSITKNYWLKPKIHWTETPAGLAAIEVAARLTLGGIFYSWMTNSKAMAAMAEYDPSTYDPNNASYLEKISFFIDKTLGAGLKNIHYMIYRDEDRASKFVRFRENRLKPKPGPVGRSLGAEMTVVTADFAAMSAGSAVMRNTLLGIFNPTERRAWLKDGKLSITHIGKRLAHKIWTICTYNAGEDMAVALPYVFSLRYIRNFLDKHMFPGFRWASDSVDNGGSVVLNKYGSVMGDYQAAGALDLQARFTIYNVYTQYYRDAYNAIGEKLKKWRQNGFKLTTPEILKQPSQIPAKLYEHTVGSVRYLVISMVTSLLQMTPSVPFFWIIRVPASKDRGLAVHPDYGVMVNKDGVPIRARQAYLDDGSKHPDYLPDPKHKREFFWSNKFDENGNREKITYQSPNADGEIITFNTTNPFADRENRKFDPFGFSKKGRRLYHNGVTRITDYIGRTVHNIADNDIWYKMSGKFWKLVDPNEHHDHHKLARDAALAAMPYASYFAAKVYFRERYVNDQMRLAVARALDGVLALDYKEFREGINEITKTMQGLPLSNPERQALLIERNRFNPHDKSPIPSDWSKELHRKYLDKIAQGKEVTVYDLAHILSHRRSNYYKEKGRKFGELYMDNHLTDDEIDEFVNEVSYDNIAAQDLLHTIQHNAKIKARNQTKSKPAKDSILNNGKADSWTLQRENELAAAELETANGYAH